MGTQLPIEYFSTPATLSITETDEFTGLVSFLNLILPSGVTVVRGQPNRVSEPGAGNFVVVWPLWYKRMETNEVSVFDNVITASIAGNILDVFSIQQLEGLGLQSGMTLSDGTALLVNGSTAIVSQLSGSVGGTGTYYVNPTQNVILETMYAGLRQDLVATEWVVQCDLHGPLSANYAQTLVNLFRSEVAVDTFTNLGSSVVPLYADEAREAPFFNGEQQVEYRWTVDLHFQVNPVTGVTQQFADTLQATLYDLP